jgi:hypothetical protein
VGEQQELARLLTTVRDEPRNELLQTAALVQFTLARRAPARPLPTALRQRLLVQGEVSVARNSPALVTNLGQVRSLRQQAAGRSSTPSPARQNSLGNWAGWAAAAALAVALVLGQSPAPVSPSAPAAVTASLSLDQLLQAPDTRTVAWNPPSAEGYEGVRGEVVWNERQQAGYLRLRGMPTNAPTEAQYQLWIVAPSRDQHPVDGGVFDVPAGGGEFLVPIQAKLSARGVTTFAITREKPGGVVVSAGPLLVVATTA